MKKGIKMKKIRRPSALLVLIVVLALVGAACGDGDAGSSTTAAVTTAAVTTPSDSGETTTAATTAKTEPSISVLDELIAAAQAEGELTMYGSIGEPVQIAMAEAFEETYGIRVNFTRRGGRDTSEAFTTEMEGGVHQVDIYQNPDEVEFVDFIGRGYLAQFAAEELPALASGWPASAWRENTYAFFSVSPHVIYYNTDLVAPEDIPTTWADINNPAFDGLIGITDPDVSANTQYTLLMIREELGDDWLRQVGEMACCYEGSSTPSAQLVAAGEAAVWFPNTVDPIYNLQAEGAPVGFSMPENTSGSERFIAVVATAPHPKAAQLFLNWVMTLEGQTVINGTFGIVSPLEGVPGAIPFPSRYEANDVALGISMVEELNALIKP